MVYGYGWMYGCGVVVVVQLVVCSVGWFGESEYLADDAAIVVDSCVALRSCD